MPKKKRAASKKKLPLRPNVCMLLVNKRGRLLLGERHGERGHWQFPQGGVRKGGSRKNAVLRELKEELGISAKKLKVVQQLRSTHSYEWTSPPSYAKGRWRGQRQTFWLVEFLGTDRDIDLESHKPEFRDWQWSTPKQVRKIAVKRRLVGYEGPLKELERWLARRKRG